MTSYPGRGLQIIFDISANNLLPFEFILIIIMAIRGGYIHYIGYRPLSYNMSNMDLKTEIKAEAARLGFDLVGICKPEYSPADHDYLLNWLNLGYHGEMAYMSRAPRHRSDPRLFMGNVKSIIAVGINYYREPDYQEIYPYISIYARGKTYQSAIRSKLEHLLGFIKQTAPAAKGKIAVDTSPTFDKLWAEKAGLGWRGKNTLLLNRKFGSFVFLSELFTDLELEPDEPEIDHCADCHKCIDACPTGALIAPHLLDANKCISYLTIETHSLADNAHLIGNHICGCDLCQIACPYNQSLKTTNTVEFQRRQGNAGAAEAWINLTESEFKSRYTGTILEDLGFIRFGNNVKVALDNIKKGNNGDKGLKSA